MRGEAARKKRAALLCRWAREEGFDRAGVAVLEPAATGPELVAWLERGDEAGMVWMRRRLRERLDPRLLLDGARSALCVGLRYRPSPADEAAAGGDLWSGVARYARGDDYHEVMWAGLDRLSRRVQEAFPGCGCRRYVDTGPVLERDLAAAAGLGAFAKNTHLLHPDDGSWFLLGELLLTLDLEPEAPLADLCGSCSACLDACPTNALTAPYRLDAKSCISYWTIEHRGELPFEIRPQLGAWVFGCDLCQEVCPWNAGTGTATEPRLGLPEARRELDLASLLTLGREEYVRLFRRSPMKRAGLEGLQRNAAVAMGNRREARYLKSLREALEGHPSPLVRGHAAWALGRLGHMAAETLGSALRRELDPQVRREIEAAQRGLAGGDDAAGA